MLSEGTSEFIKIKIMNMIHLCYNVIVEDHKNFLKFISQERHIRILI